MPGYSYSSTNTQQNSVETGACEQSSANAFAGVGNAELAGQLPGFQGADDMAYDGWGTAMAASALDHTQSDATDFNMDDHFYPGFCTDVALQQQAVRDAIGETLPIQMKLSGAIVDELGQWMADAQYLDNTTEAWMAALPDLVQEQADGSLTLAEDHALHTEDLYERLISIELILVDMQEIGAALFALGLEGAISALDLLTQTWDPFNDRFIQVSTRRAVVSEKLAELEAELAEDWEKVKEKAKGMAVDLLLKEATLAAGITGPVGLGIAAVAGELAKQQLSGTSDGLATVDAGATGFIEKASKVEGVDKTLAGVAGGFVQAKAWVDDAKLVIETLDMPYDLAKATVLRSELELLETEWREMSDLWLLGVEAIVPAKNAVFQLQAGLDSARSVIDTNRARIGAENGQYGGGVGNV